MASLLKNFKLNDDLDKKYLISADMELLSSSNNPIANSAVTNAFTDLSNALSSYLQIKDKDQKIKSTPLDILKMIDQAGDGEVGEGIIREMAISCGDWVELGPLLPDEINNLRVANSINVENVNLNN